MTEPRSGELVALAPGLAEICNLGERALTERLAWIRTSIEPHVLAREPIPGGVAYEFEDAPEIAADLERLVALERACCGGVEWVLVASDTEGRWRLEIRGLDAALASRSGAATATARSPAGCGCD